MKNIHIISHSHWDREWYMPFEYHRAKLIELIDRCIEKFETEEEFKSFNLDGHTALIEDYLEIKPQNVELIKKYVSEGKFYAGPWYVLQDEFLTSSESNIRNLLIGMKIAGEFGKINMIGYFPDSFGNAGQMPQILKQAGMKAVVFGRGVKPTGEANKVSDFSDYSSQYSEMHWQSPDGSSLPAILLANWYNNGWEMPADGASEYWDKKIADVLKYASTDELLLMNGCDHQPLQPDIGEAIKAARENYPDYNFIHSNFEDYADAIVKELPDNLAVIKGELISQNTDGWTTLVNTCSSHADLKRMNRQGEIILEGIAEPLSVMAKTAGLEYDEDMLIYAWKTLMKNHPHDSICGCSVDEVNDEMRTRFIKSRQAAETVVNKCLAHLADNIDTTSFDGCDAVFTVFNTFGKPNSGVLSVNVDIQRNYDGRDIHGNLEKFESLTKDVNYVLVDADGNKIPCSVVHNGSRFGYDLPDDSFRKPYAAEYVTVTFEAENVPAMGYKTYGLVKENTEKTSSLIKSGNCMENEYLSVKINSDGTVNLTDKATGRTFSNILRYEDVGDVGNEYIFHGMKNDVPILSGENVTIEIVVDEEYKAEYKISLKMMIPESADEMLQKEIGSMTHIHNRTAGRSKKLVEMSVDTYITLEKNGKALKVRTEFENKAKDHRLRVLIPTDIKCTEHKAESVFEAAKRNNVHNACWENPSGCEHQQGFVTMKDEQSGIFVANIGIYEYEILKDNTIALTLVRATGELGDWGVFPTNLSQQLKNLVFEYEVIPFADENEGFEIAAAFQYPMQAVQNVNISDGNYKNGGISWSGNMLRMTALKKALGNDSIIMRWVSYSDKEEILTIDKTSVVTNIFRSNVTENNLGKLEEENGKWIIKVKPFEIVTLGVE